MTGGLIFFVHKCENVVGGTFKDTAESFDGNKGDILISAETFQQAFLDPAID